MEKKFFMQKKDKNRKIKINRQCDIRNTYWSGTMKPHFPLYKNILKLSNIKYDVDMLSNELDVIRNIAWKNKSLDWHSITLKGYLGLEQPHLKETELGRGAENKYKYLDIINNCSYIKQLLEELGTDIYLVRLLKLDPGGLVKYHNDGVVFNNYKNIIRCHIPIKTNDNALFKIGCPIQAPAPGFNIWKADDLVVKKLECGFLYYTNVNTLHSVVNNGKTERIHLVIDLRPTPKMIHKIYFE